MSRLTTALLLAASTTLATGAAAQEQTSPSLTQDEKGFLDSHFRFHSCIQGVSSFADNMDPNEVSEFCQDHESVNADVDNANLEAFINKYGLDKAKELANDFYSAPEYSVYVIPQPPKFN